MARILIVDDDEGDRVLLRTLLRQSGHEVFLAANGVEALASYQDTKVDLIVTDLQMPEMHGLELISILRDVSPRPAIIAISGTGEPQLDVAHAIGADETLSKPLDHRKLLEAVRQSLQVLTERTGSEPQ